MGQLTALLLSRDPETQRTITGVLGKVGIFTETCPGPAPGIRALKSKKYEGVIVDCDDLDCGVDMLTMLRDEKYTKTTIVFALVNGTTSMNEAFGMGANFVLEKPLANDRVMRCFRAAQGLMVGERRRYFRCDVDFPVIVDFPKRFANVTARARDLSQGGMMIQTPLALIPDMEGTFQLNLPGKQALVSGSCQVVWKSGESAGLRFLEIPQTQCTALEKWLSGKFAQQHPIVSPIISDVPDKRSMH
jgi:ActR/RegA family two-component response regulator